MQLRVVGVLRVTCVIGVMDTDQLIVQVQRWSSSRNRYELWAAFFNCPQAKGYARSYSKQSGMRVRVINKNDRAGFDQTIAIYEDGISVPANISF